MSFEWENGRILKKINTSDSSIQMSYDSNGMRTQKTVGGVKTNYYYDSDKNLIALVKGNDTLLFYYDSDGSATSFSYNGTMYFYVKNLQGDVIRIIDLAGTEVASYVYDAWGNIKDTNGEPTIREINPIRYRGYVYDTETGLYYLQSRYYDPFAGRFLNADAYCDTMSGSPLSTNMFAYCENDSINYADYDGFRITVNVKRTNNSYVLKVKLPWSDISNYFNYRSIAYGIVGLVACFIPEPVVSKALGVAAGIASLASAIASTLISNYKKNKSIIFKMSFNYQKVKKAAYFYIINTWWLKVRIRFTAKSIRIYNLKWSVTH